MADVNMGSGNNATAFIMYNIGKEESSKVWYLDSGYSNHMSGSEIFFCSLTRISNLRLKWVTMKPYQLWAKDLLWFAPRKVRRRKYKMCIFPLV